MVNLKTRQVFDDMNYSKAKEQLDERVITHPIKISDLDGFFEVFVYTYTQSPIQYKNHPNDFLNCEDEMRCYSIFTMRQPNTRGKIEVNYNDDFDISYASPQRVVNEVNQLFGLGKPKTWFKHMGKNMCYEVIAVVYPEYDFVTQEDFTERTKAIASKMKSHRTTPKHKCGLARLENSVRRMW